MVHWRRIGAFLGGFAIGILGGLIGLGGAEFRLPLLLGAFAFPPLEAVIMNKAMSLVVVTSALPFRAVAVPWDAVRAHWWVIANLLAGSLVGAWLGASWATLMDPVRLRRMIAILLVLIAGVLVVVHDPSVSAARVFARPTLVVTGVLAGVVIGAVAAFLGVAGGELLIPTIVLLFGVEVKLAGSLSLCVSLPTMLVGFARYSRDRSFVVLRTNRGLVGWMALGSLAGTFLGGRLLGVVPGAILLPGLALLLLTSAVKIWRDR
jgi:uncharacterized protein